MCGWRCRCACKMNRISTPTYPQDIHLFRAFVVRERVRIAMISFVIIKDHDNGLVDQSFRNIKIDAKTDTSFAYYFPYSRHECSYLASANCRTLFSVKRLLRKSLGNLFCSYFASMYHRSCADIGVETNIIPISTPWYPN